MPHPPVMVAGIGGSRELAQVEETIRSAREIDRMLAAGPPETLVVFTPHGTVYQDAIIVYSDPRFSGGLQQFGLNRTWEWENDPGLVERLAELGREAGLPVYPMTSADAGRRRDRERLDHGVLVPLSFFDPAWADRAKLVVIPLSYLPLEELYQFGSVLRNASESLGRKIAVIASGDLSHCLQPGAPAGYDPRGAEFDRTIMELIRKEAVAEFFELDPALIEKAAECGFRSIIMLLGALDGLEFRSTVHSYQGPFGVGYSVASFRPTGGNREGLVAALLQRRNQKVHFRRERESPLVRFARKVIEAKLLEDPEPRPEGLEEYLKRKAGVFVSIKKHGQLRGCIGTIEPTQDNIIAEIAQNAISAATRDHRFDPVSVDELDDLTYSVDLLNPAEPIDGPEQLDPAKYGVIVSRGSRRGLLLPNIEGVETAAEQVAIAKRKAGIAGDEPVRLERFEVVRFY